MIPPILLKIFEKNLFRVVLLTHAFTRKTKSMFFYNKALSSVAVASF